MRLISKLLFLLCLCCCLNSYAQTRVSLNVKAVSFESVIDSIQHQTKYRFVFSESKIPLRLITLKVHDAEVTHVLTRLLKNTGYTYALLPDQLVVIKQVEIQPAQLDTATNLKEVVITALGIKKDNRKIGYAVTVVPGQTLTQARESNFILSLQGLVAGLSINGTNGGPSSSARILLRGVASMTAASPLFVINGLPIDNSIRGSANEYGGADYGDGISNINPDDIETVTILKGSAASALYGARAANGVILITLKSGKENASSSFEYNSNLAFDSPVNNTDFQYVYGQGAQNKRPADFYGATSTGISSWGEKMDGRLSPQVDGSSKPYLPAKNNITNFYRVAPAFTNTISLVGGTKRSIYRVSASNLDHSSILKNGHLNRKTFNVYGSFDLSKKLTISFNSNYIYENNKNKSYLSDGPLNANYGIAALATSLDESLLAPGYDESNGNESRWNADEYKTNPYFLLNRQADYAKRNRSISSGSVKYRFNNWLAAQGRLGYDVSSDQLLSILPTGTAFSVNRQGGINKLDTLHTAEFNTDLLLTANHSISESLDLDVSLGANYRERNGTTDKIVGSQFIIPYLYTPENLITKNTTHSISKIVTESAYFTADLAYKQLLNFSVTGRYDVYSTLPSNNRGIFVPGISGSFIFSDLLSIKNLSFGKLRLDYARTSGEPTTPYTTQIYYASNDNINGVPLGDFAKDLPNYNLKPFTLDEYEAGLNLKFFESRLTLDLTYYHRVTNNEIINAKQSVTTGFTSAYVNLGKTRNSGIETAITYTPILQKDKKWDVDFNFTYVKNTLLSIDGNSNYTLTGAYRPLNANTALVVGKPITQIMAYDYKRDASGNIIVGTDGIPKRGDFVPMGTTIPPFYGGLNNRFTFKQFQFSLLIDFRFGNKILSATENYSYVNGLNKATLVGRETGIVADGVYENGNKNTTNVPAYSYYPELASNISALSVLNGSFIKFRQATLGYVFAQKALLKTPFRSISVDLVGRNLFTLLKYTKNIDPESEFSPILAYAGIEGASLPATRTFGINFNFKFK